MVTLAASSSFLNLTITSSGVLRVDGTNLFTANSNLLNASVNLSSRSATGHTHSLFSITDAGTAASRNVPASGDAATNEVVLGSDTRLTDARTPVAHNHDASNITSGTFSPSRIGSGTPNGSNFLRGDGFFAQVTTNDIPGLVDALEDGGGGGGTDVTINGGGALPSANFETTSSIAFSEVFGTIYATVVNGSIGTSRLSSAASEYLRSRTNAIGTQPLSTISDAGTLASASWPASDGQEYVAKDGAWALKTGGGGGTITADSQAITNIASSSTITNVVSGGTATGQLVSSAALPGSPTTTTQSTTTSNTTVATTAFVADLTYRRRPTSHHIVEEYYGGAGSVFFTFGNVGGAAAIGTFAVTDTNILGSAYLESNSVGDAPSITAVGSSKVSGDASIIHMERLRLPALATDTDYFEVIIGIGSYLANTNRPALGCSLVYSTNYPSTNWLLMNSTNSTHSFVDTGIPVVTSEYQYIGVGLYSGGCVAYTNWVPVVTNTANATGGAFLGGPYIKMSRFSGTAARYIYLDRSEILLTPTPGTR